MGCTFFWRLLAIWRGEKPISNKTTQLLQQTLSDWSQWETSFASKPQVTSALEDGLTNNSFIVEAGSQRAVVRINNPKANLLGVDRLSEITILQQLQPTGLVPKIFFANSDVLVSEYIEGTALDAKNMADPGILISIKNALQVIQSIKLPHSKSRNYAAYCRDYCHQLEPLFLSKLLSQAIYKLAEKIDVSQWQPVLCHHDLIPENIIVRSSGLSIIDWEYAAMGHPQFDCLRIFNAEQITTADMPAEYPSLQMLQAVMDQLWFAIRYPELQVSLEQKLINIIGKDS